MLSKSFSQIRPLPSFSKSSIYLLDIPTGFLIFEEKYKVSHPTQIKILQMMFQNL